MKPRSEKEGGAVGSVSKGKRGLIVFYTLKKGEINTEPYCYK